MIGLDAVGVGVAVGGAAGGGVGVAAAGGTAGVGADDGEGVGTFATGPGGVEGAKSGWPMVPTPIATPARTRLVIPKATTRRARWAAVTAMGALLLRGLLSLPIHP